MNRRIGLLLAFAVLTLSGLYAASIQQFASKNTQWYGSPESEKVAALVLLLQHDNGGWPKNIRFYGDSLSAAETERLQGQKVEREETTIDNSATTSEMLFLAKQYKATKNEVYRTAFLKGLDFLHSMQYPNGGFRQFDRSKGYYTHITYNDNAMLRALEIMIGVGKDKEPFTGMADSTNRAKAMHSYQKGIDCILKTQYVQNGKKTVWCAQHDEVTLLPAKARAYELPSLSGSESVGLVMELMDISNPSPEVVEAIEGAIAWFKSTAIRDHRLQSFVNCEGQRDLRWIKSTEGNDLWGRFNELDTNRPFVCDRDGVVKYDLSEIGYERRNHYGWYTDAPLKALAKYEKWKAKWNAR